MDLVKQFLVRLLTGFDPIKAADWIRALVAVLWGGVLSGLATILLQVLAWLQNVDAPFAVDKRVIAYVMASSIIPSLVGFLRPVTADKPDGVIYADRERGYIAPRNIHETEDK